MIIIDIFKDRKFWDNLIQYNKEIIDKWEEIPDKIKQDLSCWFNPFLINEIPFPRFYPNLVPLNYDPKWVLLENKPNYPAIFVISKIYENRNVIIEERCCGLAKTSFYLNKLGFTSFSLVDDFSQIPKEIVEMSISKLKYYLYEPYLNEPYEKIEPDVIIHVGYPLDIGRPYYEADLLCMFNHPTFTNWHTEHFKEPDWKTLCKDSDDLMTIYCKTKNFDKYTEILKPYEVENGNQK